MLMLPTPPGPRRSRSVETAGRMDRAGKRRPDAKRSARATAIAERNRPIYGRVDIAVVSTSQRFGSQNAQRLPSCLDA
jgi:hypothetical protein